MSSQLIYYIALAAPPTRTPARGDAPYMRSEAGFNPSWFHHACSLDFGETWHSDPDYRLTTFLRMREEIRRRFGDRPIGGAGRDEVPDLLTGLYGGGVVAALYGQSIQYYEDKWPVAVGTPLTDDEADALRPPDPNCSPFFQGILAQMDRIEQLTGTIRGFLNWQGVLNTAFRLRGHEIFIDLLENPGRARHIFECIAQTMVQGIKLVYQRQRLSGAAYDFATISNCVVNMISPALYQEHVLPFDAYIRSQFPVFGIHNCAWNVNPYLKPYRMIPDVGYLDMGLESDLAEARRLFPEARRNVLITSMYLAAKSDDQIRTDFERIARELGPCDLGLPDIELDMPDDRVKFAMDLCVELSDRWKGATG